MTSRIVSNYPFLLSLNIVVETQFTSLPDCVTSLWTTLGHNLTINIPHDTQNWVRFLESFKTSKKITAENRCERVCAYKSSYSSLLLRPNFQDCHCVFAKLFVNSKINCSGSGELLYLQLYEDNRDIDMTWIKWPIITK